ncbi:hypothetical protein A3860_37685 [Niastella vici]|uniref:DUF5640 domain-containing protein n=1 Tax=Niastella vici TaxID=1703345 RepID=A0A1V9FMC5_9BACT|nr:hypothetical protein [Niastella vici]OQP59482.1 hypothetical protein A3860_37685 [Niastella vici]
MNRILFLFASLIVIMLAACSGSKTYRGSWKAADANGQRFELFFDAKSFSIKDTAGGKKQYDYTQNSISIENSVETYGIELADGRSYQINFPNSSDETVGLIKDGNGMPIYTISRNGYLNYGDIFKLK